MSDAPDDVFIDYLSKIEPAESRKRFILSKRLPASVCGTEFKRVVEETGVSYHYAAEISEGRKLSISSSIDDDYAHLCKFPSGGTKSRVADTLNMDERGYEALTKIADEEGFYIVESDEIMEMVSKENPNERIIFLAGTLAVPKNKKFAKLIPILLQYYS